MKGSNHNHFLLALVVGCGAMVTGTASAATPDVPSAGVEVRVGQFTTGAESERVRSEADARVDDTVATAQRQIATVKGKLQETQRRIQRLNRRLHTELSTQKANVDREVARRRNAALRSVANLSARARRLQVQLMRASIRLASSTANGAWVVVNRSGNVLNQSGGVSVDWNGGRLYKVQFDTSRAGCASIASSKPGPSGSSAGMRVSPLGDGAFSVRMSSSGGRRDGGFFLALSC